MTFIGRDNKGEYKWDFSTKFSVTIKHQGRSASYLPENRSGMVVTIIEQTLVATAHPRKKLAIENRGKRVIDVIAKESAI